ncbi:MAG: hypothetical protein H6R13_133 [Proteobacteria bacterium]|nr:hypothetical protein [Pseudomonadota bacterium]
MKTLSNPDRISLQSSKRCPLCHGSMNRIPRRFVDLVTSIFSPVQRYRCRSMKCDWEGNLPVK